MKKWWEAKEDVSLPDVSVRGAPAILTGLTLAVLYYRGYGPEQEIANNQGKG